MLTIYNSLIKKKEIFKPIKTGKISLYACGNTVYDHCHIGHARSMLSFDMIVRYLRAIDYEVLYVRNITDIDDKIIQRAHDNQESWQDLTERFIKAQREDEKALGMLSPDHEPKATEHIASIIQLIEAILAKNGAYIAKNGDVYFRVRQFKGYGKLSHRNIDELDSGARIEISDIKEDPLDFVLWKISKPNEPTWDSPWGAGRPGWHIECSAMSTQLLGQPFDIHGGGLDLKFPHHENEIAQSEAACEKTFANYWMHIGLLQVNKEKMSKSLGNFITIKEALAKHSPELIRYFMLSSHYRSPVNYSVENLQQAENSLKRLYTAIRDLPDSTQEQNLENNFVKNFHAAMQDDFNTPEAFSVLFDLAREINRLKENQELEKAACFAHTLKSFAHLFGFLHEDPQQFLKGNRAEMDESYIQAKILERHQAREAKDFIRADKIRQALAEQGVILEDKAGQTHWHLG